MQLRMIFVIFLVFLTGCASQYYDNATVKENWQRDLLQKQSWQQLVYWLTGMNLPFLDDPNWLKGLPHTQTFLADELNRVSNATLIDSQGKQWQITYSNYQKHGGYWLPYSISLTHDTVKLKLKVYTWQI